MCPGQLLTGGFIVLEIDARLRQRQKQQRPRENTKVSKLCHLELPITAKPRQQITTTQWRIFNRFVNFDEIPTFTEIALRHNDGLFFFFAFLKGNSLICIANILKGERGNLRALAAANLHFSFYLSANWNVKIEDKVSS